MSRQGLSRVVMPIGLLWAVAQAAACGDTQAGEEPDAAVTPAPTLQVLLDPLELTDMARDAVAAAPLWLRDDLSIGLAKLEPALQDTLASLVLNVEDPRHIDEVAFVIAHTSPEVLAHEDFYPELISLNARLIYEHDQALQYVELVEVGEPGVDADFFTTTRYLLQTVRGLRKRTLSPELYYWYVVHPRLEDELPFFVDGWTSSRAVAPDQGWFWRDFLWDQAAVECPIDRDCPLLVDALRDVEFMELDPEQSDDGTDASDAVYAFVHQALHWGAEQERPVQPVRIYAVACGHCGEYADLTVASLRTALIPGRNVGARSNDHTWAEWWNGQWWGELSNYSGGTRRDRLDNDCDGLADDALDDTDQDGDGITVADGDCNDTDEAVFPGATEVQNGYDDDCDGVADDGFVDANLDGDGDGWSIAEGDCHDADETIHPGATEEDNARDDDCDGISDDGSDLADADQDGFSIHGGDCDDTNERVFPDATELANGRDDDCDGVADEGLTGSDRDGDGFTMAQGDCNDLHAGVHPDALDPHLTSNRLFLISSARGDSFVSLDRTEAYGTLKSYLEFQVTDVHGEPVDGAMILLAGTWEVYGQPEQLMWAGETVTDVDGYALVTVGEYNQYAVSVTSEAGEYPGGGFVEIVVDQSLPEETYSFDLGLEGALPSRLEAPVADLIQGQEPGATLEVTVEVESYRVAADGSMEGTFSLEQPGGRVDVLVLDEQNLNRYWNGEPFQVQLFEQDVQNSTFSVDLPLNDRWGLFLSNHHRLASTMVGTLSVRVTPYGNATWSTDEVTLTERFRIPPGELLAVSLVP